MRVRPMLAVLAAVAAILGTLPATATSIPGIPAQVVDFSPSEIRTESYPVVDAQTGEAGTAEWRVVEGTGNCCEVYPYAAPGGRIYDFGGVRIRFTDDDGASWHEVEPITPLINGEGTLVHAPNGDVLGIGWDPYTGDHLQAFKYDAADKSWYHQEMPLHTPFYDRQWIAVIPGPFTDETGEEHPYITFVKGGWPSKETWLMSYDGLTYVRAASKVVDATLTGGNVSKPLPVQVGDWADWSQPITETSIMPLGEGNAFAGPDWPGLTSDFYLFEGKTMTWSTYTFGDGERPEGRFQIDSQGRVHNVLADLLDRPTSFVYRVSDDGGTTWSETTVATPNGERIEELDFKTSSAVGLAAVGVRAQGADGNDQDMVFKLDVTSEPRLVRTYDVGRGDAGATSGVGNSVRFDFESIAILPDGRVALTFLDSTTNNRPAMAVELAGDAGPTEVPALD